MKALVIGCGIGGPALAMALHEVGIDAEIYEAYGGTAQGVGSFLNLASNGLDALRAVSHTILRSDLYRIMREGADRRGVRISYGKRMVSFEDNGAQVTATFEDGTRATGDLLIAADGVRSRTRHLLDPQAPAPRYAGLYSGGGIIRDQDFTGEPGVYHMVFGKRAFFGYSVAESGETWWFANLPRALGDVPDDWRPALVEAFKDDANFSGDLVRRAEIGPMLPIHDLPPVPVWHRGRVVLTGDAAHATSPSSGQGASLAIEDAIVLARCLRDAGDHHAAFRRFEAERRGRVERVVAYAKTISNSKAAGPVARVFRDALMPFFLKRSASQESLAWMYRHQVSL